jgi:hypothetical protein
MTGGELGSPVREPDLVETAPNIPEGWVGIRHLREALVPPGNPYEQQVTALADIAGAMAMLCDTRGRSAEGARWAAAHRDLSEAVSLLPEDGTTMSGRDSNRQDDLFRSALGGIRRAHQARGDAR